MTKVRAQEREVFLFHNYHKLLVTSAGSLSWTVYRDTEPYWKHGRRGHRIHVWWLINWNCNTYKNIVRVLIKHNKLNKTQDDEWAWLEWKRKSSNYFIEFKRRRMGRYCQKDELLTVDSSIENDCNPIVKLQIFGINDDEAEDSLPALQVGGVSLYIIIVVVIVVISLVITIVVSSIRLF